PEAPGRLFVRAWKVKKGREELPILDDPRVHHLGHGQALTSRRVPGAGIDVGEGAVGSPEVDADDESRRCHVGPQTVQIRENMGYSTHAMLRRYVGQAAAGYDNPARQPCVGGSR